MFRDPVVTWFVAEVGIILLGFGGAVLNERFHRK